MSKLKEAVLGAGKAYAGNAPVSDISKGGQNGHMARIGKVEDGKYFDEWISNQAYVRRNIIPIVLSYPKFFDFMPEKEKWIEAYKALIELHPLAIDGLTSGLTVEFDEHAIGGAGEMQEEVTNVTRARSTLSFTFKEKQGKAITKFLDEVIRYGYMDPDTKKPLVANLIKDTSAFGGIYSADFTSGTVIFIEPDILQKKVVDAWLCTNMMFKSNGERLGKRDVRAAGEAPELSIESTSITLNNKAVITLGQSLLEKLTVLSKIPDQDLLPNTNVIDPTIEKANVGFNS